MRSLYDVKLQCKDSKGRNTYKTTAKSWGVSESDARRNAEKNVSRCQAGHPYAEAYSSKKIR